jgi:urease accessory protein
MTRRLSSTLRWALPGLLATGSALALAHSGTDGAAHHGIADALAAGFAHPFTGLDHLAAMVVVGVWSALTARRVGLAPKAFATALLFGVAIAAGVALFHGVAHGQELSSPFSDWALAGMLGATAFLHGSGIVLGLVMRRRATWWPHAAGAVVALFGVSLLIGA